MSKINIVFRHNEISSNCIGIINKNKIIFKTKNDNITIEKRNNEVSISKSNHESNMNMLFKKNIITKCTYHAIGLGDVLINIRTDELILENDRIYIEYEILESNDKNIYELKYEVI